MSSSSLHKMGVYLTPCRSQCCFDIDTASRIIEEVWRRVDMGETKADWKEVCDDLALHVL